MSNAISQTAIHRAWSILVILGPVFYLLCVIATISDVFFGLLSQRVAISTFPFAALSVTSVQFVGCLCATSSPPWESHAARSAERRFTRTAGCVMFALSCLSTWMSLTIIHHPAASVNWLPLPCFGSVLLTLGLTIATAFGAIAWHNERIRQLKILIQKQSALATDAQSQTTRLQAPFTCVACGYNLLGLPRNSQCPECSFAISASATAQDLLLPGLTCMQCNLPLSSLSSTGSCPQCHLPITQSIRWMETIRQIRRLSRTTHWGVALVVLGVSIAIVSQFLSKFSGLSPSLLAATALMTIGFFLITKLPDREFPPAITWHFTLIRSLAIAISAFAVAISTAQVLYHHAGPPRSSLHLMIIQVCWIMWFACLAFTVPLAAVFRRRLK